MKINRLFEIVYILISKKSVTALELSKHFEVSTRTIYRDLDILSTAGIPVYANKGKSGGIMIADKFVLNKTVLSKKEQNDILFALQSIKEAKYPDTGEILSKLRSFFNKPLENWIQIDFSSWGGYNGKKFIKLKDAILNKKIIKFDYFATSGKKSRRETEPLQLWFKERSWYLKAFCIKRNALRLFKISRMKNISVMGKIFKRELKNDAAGKLLTEKHNAKQDIKIILKIDSKQAYRVYDEFDEKQIRKEKNGNFIVTISFPENEWVYGYILSFGQFCEVISPEHIREIIKDRLKAALAKYL